MAEEKKKEENFEPDFNFIEKNRRGVKKALETASFVSGDVVKEKPEKEKEEN